jgi:mannose-6-phosphate isomerase
MKFYPLKFHPIVLNKIWGSEIWTISAVKDNVSIVKNGAFAGEQLSELVKKYPKEILGENIVKKYGSEFPLLFKTINAEDKLSIQVHPDDDTAKEYGSLGKTEMWFVLSAKEDAKLLCGFKEKVSKEKFLSLIENGEMLSALASYKVKAGDAFFINAGTVHGIGGGLSIAEIQQSSDITFRIYDYERTEEDGSKRELHIPQSIRSIKFETPNNSKIKYEAQKNKSIEMIKCPKFRVNFLSVEGFVKRELKNFGSFIVFMAVGGNAKINDAEIENGESILIPAEIADIEIEGSAQLLEICTLNL